MEHGGTPAISSGTPRICDGLSNEDYHSGPGVSKSGLDLISRSPAHFRYAKNNPDARRETAAFKIGGAGHALILEPDVFRREFCRKLRPQDIPGTVVESTEQLVEMIAELNRHRLPKIPTSGSKAQLVERIVNDIHDGDSSGAEDLESMTANDLKAMISNANASRPGLLSTSGTRAKLLEILRTEGRNDLVLWSEALEEWNRNNGHMTPLSDAEWEHLHAVAAAVHSHPAASALLTSARGVAERSVYWREGRILCRCRPDWWRDDGVLVDLKTTADASPEAFARSVAKYRYHVQAAYYLDGCRKAIKQAGINGVKPPKAFVFIAVEKTPPYNVGVYRLNSEAEELGREEYKRDLVSYARCHQSKAWPGYSENIESLSLPRWYFSARNED